MSANIDTGQICMGFKADNLEKVRNLANFIRFSEKYWT